MPNFLILEYARKPPYFEDVLRDPLVLEDGHFELSDRPGLGVELDDEFVEAHGHHFVANPANWQRDGSVADV